MTSVVLDWLRDTTLLMCQLNPLSPYRSLCFSQKRSCRNLRMSSSSAIRAKNSVLFTISTTACNCLVHYSTIFSFQVIQFKAKTLFVTFFENVAHFGHVPVNITCLLHQPCCAKSAMLRKMFKCVATPRTTILFACNISIKHLSVKVLQVSMHMMVCFIYRIRQHYITCKVRPLAGYFLRDVALATTSCSPRV